MQVDQSQNLPLPLVHLSYFINSHFTLKKKLNYFISQNVRIKNPVKVLHILT